jgi:hypothetical protein
MLLCFMLAGPAYADNAAVTTSDAKGWILENYTPGGLVVIWYTGAKCANSSQNIVLSNPSAGEVNRLWATVAAAKISGAKIFVWYNTADCNIVSFGFAQ